jgi:uncharacterized protein (TIGR02145 family)
MKTTNLIYGKNFIKPGLARTSKTFVLIMSVAITYMLTSCKSANTSETVKDADGNIYHTVKIGNQVWTVEDLKTTKFNDGTPIPNVTDAGEWNKLTTPGYCHHNNKPENIKNHGVLYNWYAASSGKIAPTGWRVPTREDQLALRDYLIANGHNYDGTTEGNKVAKSMATTIGWPYKNLDAYGNPIPDSLGMVGNNPQTNNKSGYSAFPAGSRWYDGSFHAFETSVYWWSVTPYNDQDAYHTSVHTWFSKFGDNHHDKRSGFCIRLIRE